MWSVIKEWIDEFVLLKYKADKHVLPPRKRTKTRTTTTENINLAGHSVVRGQLWAPDNGDDVRQTTAAWRQDDVRNDFGQRQAELTDKDIEELNRRGLNVLKAKVIKPYWAQGLSREEISSILSNAGGRKVRGYSVATVGRICAALSHSPPGGEDI